MEHIQDLFSSSFVDRDPLPGQRPDRRGVEEILRKLHGSMGKIQFTLESIVAEGTIVAYRLFGQGTISVHLFDTQSIVVYECVGMFRIRNERFTERWGRHQFRYL